ncbi:hypothetical protein KRP22_011381 [Phytophthora ramorum]|nr:Secreted RxLR effector protein [Phytophthora ramorum]
MAVKTTYWAQMQKSDDFVKKTLKLDGLTKGAVKASPKYKYYQKYLYKTQGVKMDNWAFNEVNLKTIWNKLGLGTMSATQREGSPALKIYARYARKYDGAVYHSGYKAYTPSTDAEMDVLLRVWAQADRSSDYVRKRLGVYSNVIVTRDPEHRKSMLVTTARTTAPPSTRIKSRTSGEGTHCAASPSFSPRASGQRLRRQASSSQRSRQD